jgi:hypothetical protein
MRLTLLRGVFLASWSAGATQAPIPPPPEFVGTWHPQRATEIVRTFAGRCGVHSYFISVAPESSGPGGLREVRVDGKQLPDSELQTVRASIKAQTVLMDASIKECRTNGAARLRLFAVNPQVHPVDERFIDFTVDAQGVVQDLQSAN